MPKNVLYEETITLVSFDYTKYLDNIRSYLLFMQELFYEAAATRIPDK